jgi:hypothetical protein
VRKRDLIRGQRVASERGRASIVHITQDDYGYWMMTMEEQDGSLHLMVSGMDDAEHIIGQAYNPDEIDLPSDVTFHVSSEERPIEWPCEEWVVPAPRRTPDPYYRVRSGKRLGK